MDLDDATTLERHLLERELALARRDRVALGFDLVELLHDEFAEIGASGRRWDRASMSALLTADEPADVTIADFVVTRLSDGLALATYRSVRRTVDGGDVALRSSIWDRRGGDWRLRFHQGTPAVPEED